MENYYDYKIERIERAYNVNTSGLKELLKLILYKYPDSYPEFEYIYHMTHISVYDIILKADYPITNLDIFHPEYQFFIRARQSIDYWKGIRYTIQNGPNDGLPSETKPIGYTGKYDYLPQGQWKVNEDP